MRTRKATIEDVERVSVLFDQYRVFYKQAPDPEGTLQFISERVKRAESVIFVVLLDDKIVGFTQLYPIFSSVGMKRAWLLNDLFVAEDARGSGAADALLAAAQSMGAETDARWMMLQTATTNHRAQKVYERNGWEKDADYYAYYFKFREG